jgi:hypothetical protein
MSNLSEVSFVVRGQVMSEDDVNKTLAAPPKKRIASGVKKFKGFVVTGVSMGQLDQYIKDMSDKQKKDKSDVEIMNIALRQIRPKRLHKPFNIPQAAQEFATMATKEGYIKVSVSTPKKRARTQGD